MTGWMETNTVIGKLIYQQTFLHYQLKRLEKSTFSCGDTKRRSVGDCKTFLLQNSSTITGETGINLMNHDTLMSDITVLRIIYYGVGSSTW